MDVGALTTLGTVALTIRKEDDEDKPVDWHLTRELPGTGSLEEGAVGVVAE
jgi:hypothetical protein